MDYSYDLKGLQHLLKQPCSEHVRERVREMPTIDRLAKKKPKKTVEAQMSSIKLGHHAESGCRP